MGRFRRNLWAGLVVGSLAVGAACSPRVVAPATNAQQDVPEDATPITAPPDDVKALVEGNNHFAIDMYKKLLAGKDGNILFSPYSISSAMGMVYAGARGDTADEIAAALHFRVAQDQLHPVFRSLNQSFNASGQSGRNEVAVANALWKQKGIEVEPGFAKVMETNYTDSLQDADFDRDPNGSLQAINKWTEKHTRGRLKSFLDRGKISQQTRLVIANSMYFQGRWKEQFEKANTQQDEFEIEPGRKVPVSMMSRADAHVRYAETSDYSLLELPYTGDRWAMVFLLPAKRFGLREVEAKLTASHLGESLRRLTPATKLLHIPRFKLSTSYDLKPAFEGLGVRSAFTPAADFTGICLNPRVQIAWIEHGANLEVDEVGTVATATTAVGMNKESASTPFKIDQPFIAIITDAQSGVFTFLGRVVDPR